MKKLIAKPYHGMIVITWNLDKTGDGSFISNATPKETARILREFTSRISTKQRRKHNAK